jgi:hypothetical protein
MVILRTFTAHHQAGIKRAWPRGVNLPINGGPKRRNRAAFEMMMRGEASAGPHDGFARSDDRLQFVVRIILRRNMRASISTTKV